MSIAEVKNENTQNFKKVTKALKGDLLGTVDIKTTKETWPLLEDILYQGGIRES